MAAKTISDTTVRTVHLALKDTPDLQVNNDYRLTRPSFCPNGARITIREGRTDVLIAGPRRLKSGALSENSEEGAMYSTNAWRKSEKIESAPQWVRELLTSVMGA